MRERIFPSIDSLRRSYETSDKSWLPGWLAEDDDATIDTKDAFAWCVEHYDDLFRRLADE